MRIDGGKVALGFGRPIFVMLKPVGARCNLRCRYCYYLDKRKMYGGGGGMEMTEETLEEFTRQYLEAQTQPETLFIWHGGEPLLRDIGFYQRALEMQRRYGGGRRIDNCLQTNGTLIDDRWAAFFKENNFLIGLSIDGPRRFHDEYRSGSFDRVMRGIDTLNRHGVEWNAMAVVNSLNVRHPREFYRFFKEIGCRFIQFEPIVEVIGNNEKFGDFEDFDNFEKFGNIDIFDRNGGIGMSGTGSFRLSPESISAEEWGWFLCELFDEWEREDVGEVFVQFFESVLANMAGVAPSLCSLAPVCGQSAALEHNGDLFSCDHFVFPEYRLGNIRQNTITEMMYSRRQTAFGRGKFTSLPRQCRECEWLRLCNGECPKNRIATDKYGNPGMNHLCQGFRRFFSYAAPRMKRILETLQS